MQTSRARHDQMLTALRDAGVRVTRQRIALLGLIAEANGHPDAAELHLRAQNVEPGTSLATVYRTLSVLERAGLVIRHNFENGTARFEPVPEKHHDHIVDIDTGTITEFYSEGIERLQREVAERHGYEVIHHRMELYCRKVEPAT